MDRVTAKRLRRARNIKNSGMRDVVFAVGDALDPLPAHMPPAWHSSAARAFLENFIVLSLNHKTAMDKLVSSGQLEPVTVRMIKHGETARKKELSEH